MKINEGVPPLVKQNEGNDAPESLERRAFLEAVRNFGLGVVGAALVGVDTTEARSFEVTSEMEQARREYERQLSYVPIPATHRREGERVLLGDLLVDLPLPDPYALFGKEGIGIVIIPTFHTSFTFSSGKLVDSSLGLDERDRIVGTAKTSKGYHTPRGFFRVYRKEGAHYSSDEYPVAQGAEPNMPYAMFIDAKNEYGDIRGIAIHGSNNINSKNIILDNSHGCINVSKEYARTLQQVIELGAPVLILDDIKNIGTQGEIADKIDDLYNTISTHSQQLKAVIGTVNAAVLSEALFAQPDVSKMIASIQKFSGETLKLIDESTTKRVLSVPLRRNDERLHVGGVRIAKDALLLAKNAALRVFKPREGKLIQREAAAPITDVTTQTIDFAQQTGMAGAFSFVLSRDFESGIALEGDGAFALPTFVMPLAENPALQGRMLSGIENRAQAEGWDNARIERTKKLVYEGANVGILRPNDIRAFFETRKASDRGEPVFVGGKLTGGVSGADGISFAGLVLEWVPLLNEKGELPENDEDQWGMVLISTPQATKQAIEEANNPKAAKLDN